MNFEDQDFEEISSLDFGPEKSGSDICENHEKTSEKAPKQEKKTKKKKNISKKKERIATTARKSQEGKKGKKNAKGNSSTKGKSPAAKQRKQKQNDDKMRQQSCSGKKGYSKSILKAPLKSKCASSVSRQFQTVLGDKFPCENPCKNQMADNRGHTNLSLAVMGWLASCQTFSKLMDPSHFKDEKISPACCHDPKNC